MRKIGGFLRLAFILFSVFASGASAHEDQIALLKKTILKGLDKTSPHSGEVGGSGIFHGNVDYHSSVEAYWALLSIARITQDGDLQNLVLSRFTPQALQLETDFLNSADQSDFEVPYGQGWLSLMLSELAKVYTSDPATLNALRLQVENRELTWLSSHSLPEYQNQSFDADYHSWIFGLAILNLIGSPASPDLKEKLEALKTEKLDPERVQISQFEPGPYEFLSLQSLTALIDLTGVKPVAPDFYRAPASPNPESDCDDNDTCHQVGRSIQEIWASAAEANLGNTEAEVDYESRIDWLFAHPQVWQKNFEHASHWLPQYMWMAIWLRMGGI
jgi:hypothetical protein